MSLRSNTSPEGAEFRVLQVILEDVAVLESIFVPKRAQALRVNITTLSVQRLFSLQIFLKAPIKTLVFRDPTGQI